MRYLFCLMRDSFCQRRSPTGRCRRVRQVRGGFEASDNQLTNTVKFKDLLLQGRNPVIDVCLDVLQLCIRLGEGFGLCSFHLNISP